MGKRILFVDDEGHLLDGLRRAMRIRRKVWDMRFARSAEEALDLVRNECIDVIVTDMHMPAMDGAQLLGEILKISPETIRIVLTGHSDENLVMRTVGIAHQYLAKPCDAETLQHTVAHALQLRDLVQNVEVRNLVAGIQTLPSLPRIYRKITTLLQTQDFSLMDVGQLIATDPPMTAKLLQLANSAFFGIGRRITDPVHATTLLGLDAIKNLVLASGAFSQFETEKVPWDGTMLEALWERSLRVGRLARRIAEVEGMDNTVLEDCLVAGLLHEIGTLVVLAELPGKWRQISDAMHDPDVDIDTVEQEVLGTHRDIIGAFLLGLWGLPDTVVAAVACNKSPRELEQRVFSPLTAVHVAHALTSSPQGAVDSLYLEQLGLIRRLAIWKTLAAENC